MILLNKKEIKRFYLDNKVIDKMLLNDSIIFVDEEKNKFVRGWDTQIILNITSRASAIGGATSGFSDLVFFAGMQSMQLKYCNNGRNSGSAVITRTGKAEAEQPRARNVPVIPPDFVPGNYDVKVDIKTSSIYVNSAYYYITDALGSARRINMNSSTDYYCSPLWSTNRPVNITLYNFVPSKLTFNEWFYHGRPSPLTYNIKVTATNLEDPTLQVILCDKTGVDVPGSYPWTSEYFDLSLLNQSANNEGA